MKLRFAAINPRFMYNSSSNNLRCNSVWGFSPTHGLALKNSSLIFKRETRSSQKWENYSRRYDAQWNWIDNINRGKPVTHCKLILHSIPSYFGAVPVYNKTRCIRKIVVLYMTAEFIAISLQRHTLFIRLRYHLSPFTPTHYNYSKGKIDKPKIHCKSCYRISVTLWDSFHFEKHAFDKNAYERDART